MGDELTCEEVVELVTDALEGALPPDRQREFDDHLAGCPHCPTYVAQIRVTLRALRALCDDATEPAELDHLRAAFRARREPAR